jgi:hypothetical protein
MVCKQTTAGNGCLWRLRSAIDGRLEEIASDALTLEDRLLEKMIVVLDAQAE